MANDCHRTGGNIHFYYEPLVSKVDVFDLYSGSTRFESQSENRFSRQIFCSFILRVQVDARIMSWSKWPPILHQFSVGLHQDLFVPFPLSTYRSRYSVLSTAVSDRSYVLVPVRRWNTGGIFARGNWSSEDESLPIYYVIYHKFYVGLSWDWTRMTPETNQSYTAVSNVQPSW